MSVAQLPPDELDLTSCDREPIHVPGSVQPHGVMLVADPRTLTVLQAAGDATGLLGRSVEDALGETLDGVLGRGDDFVAPAVKSEAREPVYLGTVALPGVAGGRLDVTAHRRAGALILELEPAPADPSTAAEMLARVRKIGVELESAFDLQHLFEVAVHEARKLTGFDRVMIYRFLDDGAGAVVAEERRDDLDPMLNQHFPASDIPKQARALYLQNLIRVIPDVGYTPSPLVPAEVLQNGGPLDMGDCALRSVSPIHIQYLKNMGVAASMSVSLVRDGHLWGLVSCHHTEPRLVPYDLREASKHLGEILSQQIKAREDLELHRQRERLSTLREEMITQLAGAPSLAEALSEACSEVLGLVPADGAAIRLGREIFCCGHAPDHDQVSALTDWLIARESGLLATDRLPAEHEAAGEFAAAASGLLSVVVSREEPTVLLWFRAEHVEVVNWAGNPHKPAAPGAEPGILSPRQSFEAWKETVRNRSRAWTPAEVDAARRFRQALIELRQHERLRELNHQLRRTLSEKEELIGQKDLLMQEVHHRVQNSLQLVNAMLQLQARESAEPTVKDQFEEASRRIVAVSMVHRRLWWSERIHEVDFGSYLEDLLDGLVDTWGAAWEPHVKISADPVLVPTSDAVVLALVVTELLTNAVKYAYGGGQGPIDVDVRELGVQGLRVTVRDRGVGMDADPKATGLGSRLTRVLVSQLGGEVRVTANAAGTAVALTLPRPGEARR